MKKFLYFAGRLWQRKKIFSLVWLLFVPQVALAQSVGSLIWDDIPTLLSNLILWIGVWIAGLIGLFIAFLAWVIETLLLFNQGLLESSFVEAGFEVSLSVVNLGFVFALIVIAVATILRVDRYAMKKTLSKLIAAALLVNFSLVIASAFLLFSNNLSNYLLDTAFPRPAFEPSVEGVKGTSFGLALMQAYAPQKYFNPSLEGSNFDQRSIDALRTFSTQQSNEETNQKGIISSLAAVGMMVLGLMLIMVVLVALMVMLLARYVWVAGLLIVMPFAWFLWIFPSTDKHWHAWWGRFLNQVFFPPIVLFTVWMVIQIGRFSGDVLVIDSKGSGVHAALANGIGVWASGIATTLLNGLLLNGLMIGGLIFSQKIGIHGADMGLKWAAATKKAYGNYVGRNAARAATRYTLRGERGQKVISRLQSSGRTLLGSMTTAQLGRGLERLANAGGVDLVKEADGRLKGMTTTEMAKNISTFDTPMKIAALSRIKNDGKLLEIEPAILRQLLNKDKEEQFKRYKEGELFKSLRGESGLHIVEQIENLKDPAQAEAVSKNLDEHFRMAPNPGFLAEFFKAYEKQTKDGKQAPFNLSKDDYENMQVEILKRAAKNLSPQNFSELIRKAVKGDALEQIKEIAKRMNGKEGMQRKDFSDFNWNLLKRGQMKNLVGDPYTLFSIPHEEREFGGEDEETGEKKKATLYDAQGRPVR